MKYRDDINGLRAVAVLPVLFFHAGLGAFSGGFVGVDIFFVISGYLITRIIHDEIVAGNFSIARFYERRIRRILPALFAVMAFTTILACFLLIPPDLASYGKSVSATTAFVSNIFFWKGAGYFEGQSDLKPLLHTWSLAVEEQFYIGFPLLMMLIARRLKGAFSLWIGIFAFLSFVLCAVAVEFRPSAAFYLSPMRAWELMAGSLLAVGAFPRVYGRVANDFLAVLGFMLILLPIFFYSHDTKFPGVSALPPVLGAALIIYTGEHQATFISRLLSIRPMLWIGLISYSLYLWHWPLIVFWRYFRVEKIGLLESLCLIAVSILFAKLSWSYVEQPFRSAKKTGDGQIPSRSKLFMTTTAYLLAIGLGGFYIAVQGGFPKRFAEQYPYYQGAAERKQQAQASYRYGECFFADAGELDVAALSSCARPQEVPGYLLFGDSHAAHLWPGLRVALPEVDFLQVNYGACKALIDMNTNILGSCGEFNKYVFGKIIPENKYAGVLLASRWTADNIESLGRTIDYIKRYNSNIVLIGPVVEYYRDVPDILQYSRDPVASIHAYRDRKVDLTDAALAELAHEKGIKYFSVRNALCKVDNCVYLAANGKSLQWDYGHLTIDGSILVAQSLKDAGLIGHEADHMASTATPGGGAL